MGFRSKIKIPFQLTPKEIITNSKDLKLSDAWA